MNPNSVICPNSNNITNSQQFSLTPHERSRIARYADIGGNTPFVGAIVGLARIIGGIAIGFFACCGMIGQVRQMEHTLIRAIDEGSRGVLELFSLGIGTYFLERRYAKEELRGIIGDLARGKYVYQSPGGCLHYSNLPFSGNVEVISKRRVANGGTLPVKLQFDEEATKKAKGEISLNLF